jgi:hypothetical protein
MIGRILRTRRLRVVICPKMLWLYTALIGAFIVFNPFALYHPQRAGSDLALISKSFARDRYFTYPSPGIAYYARHLFPYTLTAPVLLCAMAGLAMSRHRRRDWVLLATLACFVFLPAITNLKVVRYVLFSAPFLCLYAARWLTAASASRVLRAVRGLALLIAALIPALHSIAYLSLMGQPDPRLKAQQWLLGHVPAGSELLSLHDYRSLYPPVLYAPRSPFAVVNDALRRPELLQACKWPLVTSTVELFGIHDKYRVFPEKYAPYRRQIAPLLDSGCYRLAARFANAPVWLHELTASPWLPLDLYQMNPVVLVYLPVTAPRMEE